MQRGSPLAGVIGLTGRTQIAFRFECRPPLARPRGGAPNAASVFEMQIGLRTLSPPQGRSLAGVEMLSRERPSPVTDDQTARPCGRFPFWPAHGPLLSAMPVCHPRERPGCRSNAQKYWGGTVDNPSRQEYNSIDNEITRCLQGRVKFPIGGIVRERLGCRSNQRADLVKLQNQQ